MPKKIYLQVFICLTTFYLTTAQNPASRLQDFSAFVTPFEKNDNYSATYSETIEYYQNLASKDSRVGFFEFGDTDSGHPLHIAVLSNDSDFEPASIKEKGKAIILINNAIHPGEPCGVDACMMLFRDLLEDNAKSKWLEDVVLVVIPFYNIGGGLNRSGTSRANQLGPEAHGFRGNAQNLDLNRDFIKCDSRNAQTFNQIFQHWMPDVFLDTHTSNGADYQYSMSLVATQHNKLEGPLATYFTFKMLPRLYSGMEADGWDMTPYVNVRKTPEDGIMGFFDSPRYSSGYAALFNTFSFMTEAHMLKPFKNRVRGTYACIENITRIVAEDKAALLRARAEAIEGIKTKKNFSIQWEPAYEKAEMITFKGYTPRYKPSEITGEDRLYYDREVPFEKPVPYLNSYKPTLRVDKPVAYIIPQAYRQVIERLRWNNVEMHQLSKDQKFTVEMYRIKDYETTSSPYEGHYLHSKVIVEKEFHDWTFREGDYVVYMNQAANKYILECLEPQAPDSYFAWNFFDGILMQKEYFSSYVFEDYAVEFLKSHPEVKEALEAKKKEDARFAKNARAQLDFVYKRSPYYEITHMLYPVGRLTVDQPMQFIK